MAKIFIETAHGSCTAYKMEKPETGGECVEAIMEGEYDPTTDVWLEDVRVLPEGRGQGEGTQLLDELEQRARGCRRIIGVFNPSNFAAALNLYGNAKYKIAESKRDPSIQYIIKDLKKT